MTKNPHGNNGDPEGQRLATPRWFIQYLREQGFQIDLDVCADVDNAVCDRYYTEAADGLAQSWDVQPGTWAWCNPPFGNILLWVEKAKVQQACGNSSLMVTPCRPETEWFYSAAQSATKCSIIKPRLNYLDTTTGKIKSGITFASCLWEFRDYLQHEELVPILGYHGTLRLHYLEARRPKGAI